MPPFTRPMPTSPTAGLSAWQRLGRFGKLGGPLSLYLLDIRSSPTIPVLPGTADDYDRELRRLANDALDPYDAEYNNAVRDWYLEQLKAYPTHRDIVAPTTEVAPDTVRVDGKKKEWKCLGGEYDKIVDECKAMGGKTHHVVPDMSYRLGDCRGLKSKERTPNAPTEAEGKSICLTADQHKSERDSSGVHDVMRPEFKGIDHPDFLGTAPMLRIVRASQKALLATKGINLVCAAYANSLAEVQVRGTTGLVAPGRTKESPLPSGRIADVLRAGSYPS